MQTATIPLRGPLLRGKRRAPAAASDLEHAGAGPYGSLDGQVFALAVMAVAAAEVVVGLGLVVAMARRKIEIDVDLLSRLRK